MSYIPNHMDAIRGLIPEQYKTAAKLNGLIAAIMQEGDEVETMLQELRGLWDIQSMEGVNLDTIGMVVGVKRKAGESDTDYRQRLESGSLERELPTYEALRRMVQAVTGSERVGLYPEWPAGVYVVVETAGETIQGRLDQWAASGVSADLGTFLCLDYAPSVYIVSEDTGAPFVIDWVYVEPPEAMQLVDNDGNVLTDSENNILII